MSNLNNELKAEEKREEMIEDTITKKDLVGIIEVTLQRLIIEIKSEDSDDLVRSFSMYLHKFITNKVKEVDEDAKAKVDKFCEENTDFWHDEACH
jgi:hypothetical protein|tara:strand:+ start:65 stop:349 length:285 start_codon:yes stop_codon:yes gene_type:complete